MSNYKELENKYKLKRYKRLSSKLRGGFNVKYSFKIENFIFNFYM